ncbi:N-methyl-L-tryptophan oxidase [Streptomyces endophyticus]|uniref:N-methyl-L-tryptophan oxidase n=1 Tax=Streptomyces endophyticus TaxID=714166 RepID=A0ABU6F7P3_9ACTN|nr:N-methyl-L-tryptophan oxidase [Streptomyces endophyticus]MEB8338817.1 N-methyl-L-tryptophan oxidase [Streptomyces endophyticus]
MPTSPLRVAVVGTGVIGAMTAWHLAARGAEVLALDAYAPGHDRGASAGESRIFRTAYKEGASYVPLLRRSYELWRRLESEADRELLTLCGGLTLGPPDHPDLRAVRGSAAEHGLDVEVLDAKDAARRFPQHRLDADEIAVLDPGAGVLRPEPAVQSALARAQELGAQLLPYHRVDGLDERPGGGWHVRTQQGTYDVDHVVLSPGPWSGSFARLAGLPLQGRRITAAWFAAKDVAAHRPDRLPIAIRRHHEAGFSCFPVLDGTAVKIVPHHLPWHDTDAPEDLPRSADTGFARAASAAVARLLPGLVPHPVRIGVYAEAFSADDHALVGPLPGARDATLLAGFSGHGFKLAPVFGEIAASLVTDGKSPYDISFLDPARFTG